MSARHLICWVAGLSTPRISVSEFPQGPYQKIMHQQLTNKSFSKGLSQHMLPFAGMKGPTVPQGAR